ncbi:hypothetical protein ARV1_gp26 [Acidianus rod-shaped virus 1]|uniref:Uncharacterized protein n=1 Tax=Acidianus rod-shaped virus 1 TaxID=309181 RepID=Q50I45_9VIRU|nr:hypothetical protein ARV1_gp26 [Acidianus rod-shaped virus 1]CAI44181.1 hypothetical protein [Acidianus rod-shaped virus 1]
MARKHGYRSTASMKYHLYHKIFSKSVFPAFNQMFNAGVRATLPSALESIKVPPYFNTDYGVAFASIISSFLSALNNFASLTLNNINTPTTATSLGIPATTLQQQGIDAIADYAVAYDSYVKLCAILYQVATFDETDWDYSVYAPGNGTLFNNEACGKLKILLTKPPTTVVDVNVETLGIGSTQIPQVDSGLLSATNNTGAGELLNKLSRQKGVSPSNYFETLPDLSKYLLSFLPIINKDIDGGIALDVAWFDRSAFSAPTADGSQQLEDGVILQNFSQAIGMVLDLTPLDFAPLMPDFPENGNLSIEDLVAILSTDKAIISVFGSVFEQHLHQLGPGATNVAQSQYAETFISSYEIYMQIQKIVNRKYSNIWYAKMVADAALQVARYPYLANLSYASGQRTLPYDQFLQQWKTQWKLYGLTDADLQYALQLGQQYQGQALRQSQQKLEQKSVYAKTYKPLFYYNNFRSVAER